MEQVEKMCLKGLTDVFQEDSVIQGTEGLKIRDNSVCMFLKKENI